jgi:hypothetical protein
MWTYLSIHLTTIYPFLWLDWVNCKYSLNIVSSHLYH